MLSVIPRQRSAAPMTDTGSRTRQEDIRDHLANERTFLAWLRTSLAIITFGIGLNRFSLYLNELAAHGGPPVRTGTGRLGIGMVAVGMGLLVWGAVRYEIARRQIEAREFRAVRVLPWAITTVVLLLAGAALFLVML
jgi:putative membrane protein